MLQSTLVLFFYFYPKWDFDSDMEHCTQTFNAMRINIACII